MSTIVPLPVRRQWFSRQNVEPGLDLLTEPAVHRWFRANIWYVRGRDLDLIIDPGMGIAALGEALRADMDRPILAVATHGHIDHIGGMHEFTNRAIHPDDAPALEGDDHYHLASFFRSTEDAVTAIPHDGWALSAFTVKAAPATRLLGEGDRIDLGDRAFTVLHLPGHSPGQIGLFDEITGTLFSGDALYDGQLLDDLPRSDPAIYEATMIRLEQLDANRVHGGHGNDFDRARMQVLIEDYLRGRRQMGCPKVAPTPL
ncbi:MBL fold metallo-hydrolase [Rhodoligotrophos defluvii]|uniref:MBL fold metallo-hydrolase n=1 Tax=Rhodoligotrophos defluvii TaxID=2561934 RepID=UPI001EEFD9B2|nr:MBL fold metallo-hydrolase [Rhodoligotrophos defluvii]